MTNAARKAAHIRAARASLLAARACRTEAARYADLIANAVDARRAAQRANRPEVSR